MITWFNFKVATLTAKQLRVVITRLLRQNNTLTYSSIMSTNQASVFVTSSLVPDEALNLLRNRFTVQEWTKLHPIPRDELLKSVKGTNAIFCSSLTKIDAELLDTAGPILKVIGTCSVGYDHINLPECKKRNILVGNTPDVLTDAVAELTIGLLLATCRDFFNAREKITNGEWEKVVWAPMYMCGSSLKDSNIGLVGFGRIGQAIADRLTSFKVKSIVYSCNSPKSYDGAKFVPFEDLISTSDYIIICCAFNPQTSKMFDKAVFSKMKNTAILINVSRGGVIDQDALIEALQTNEIRAAGLDVMTPEPLPIGHPLTKLSNCTLLPHIGSACTVTRIGMATLTAQNIIAGLEGQPLPAPL